MSPKDLNPQKINLENNGSENGNLRGYYEINEANINEEKSNIFSPTNFFDQDSN